MEVKAMNTSVKAVENISVADTTETIVILLVPPGAYPIAFEARVKTAFAGVTYPTVKVGEGTILNGFIPKQPIDKIGGLKSGFARDGHTFCTSIIGGAQKAETNRTIIATFESTAGNLSSLTAGEIEFVLVYAE